LALASHAYIYVALACCSWVANAALPANARNAAAIAAIALGAISSSNLRELMGLDEKLRALSTAPLDPEVLGCASEFHLGVIECTPALVPVLERIVARLEQEVANSRGLRQSG